MEYWRGIIFFGNYVYYHWSREPGEDRDGYRGMCTGVSSLLSFFFFLFFSFFNIFFSFFFFLPGSPPWWGRSFIPFFAPLD